MRLRAERNPTPVTESTLWWHDALHERPAGVDERATRLIAETIRHAIATAPSRLGAALTHAAWAVGYRARRCPRGWPQVAVRYLEIGAGVCSETARRALDLVSRVVGCVRTRTGHLTATPEAVAACWDVTTELVEAGALPRPACHRAPHPAGPTVDLGLPPEHGAASRAYQCPCPGHANGDSRPSLVYGRIRDVAKCLTTGRVWRRDPDGWRETRLDTTTIQDQTQYRRGVSTRGADYVPGSLRGARGAPLSVRLTEDGMRRSAVKSVLGTVRWWDRAASWDRSRLAVEVARQALRLGDEEGARRVLPDRLVTLDRYEVSAWRELPSGRVIPVPGAWDRVGSRLSVIDVDGLSPGAVDGASLARVVAEVGSGHLEPLSVVETSSEGVQVLVRWRWWWPDWSPGVWSSRWHVDLLRRCADGVVARLGRGGWVDEAVWRVGSTARLPGWRVRHGQVVRARLRWFQ